MRLRIIAACAFLLCAFNAFAQWETYELQVRGTALYDDMNSKSTAFDSHLNLLNAAIDYNGRFFFDTAGLDAVFSGSWASGKGAVSENTYYDFETERQKSKAVINVLAPKLKLGSDNYSIVIKGGYVPINAGTLGSTWRINTHSYRGVQADVTLQNFVLSYGWADQFLNEWDNRHRDITNDYFQNRPNPYSAFTQVKEIDYLQGLGVRYNLPYWSFVDLGTADAKDWRRTAHLAVSVPYQNDAFKLSTTAYGFWGKFYGMWEEENPGENPTNEWNASLKSEFEMGGLKLSLQFVYTYAPDTFDQVATYPAPYSNSDYREFNYVRGQLDEHTWHGQKDVALSVSYTFEKLAGFLDITLGAQGFYGFGLKVPDADKTGTMYEVDTFLALSPLKDLEFKVAPSFLRTKDFYSTPLYGAPYGVDDIDDVQISLEYKYTFL